VLEYEGQSASGQGVATDIIEAAGRAYVRALSNAVRKVQTASQGVDLGANEPVGAP
jgi:2-isopropylmalate synthase